jgi:hypothetical protein
MGRTHKPAFNAGSDEITTNDRSSCRLEEARIQRRRTVVCGAATEKPSVARIGQLTVPFAEWQTAAKAWGSGGEAPEWNWCPRSHRYVTEMRTTRQQATHFDEG